ncbi:hypothetical protein P171DRAFT_109841 [Karstenula rhodostoma CBS 690.94]|uniref:Uncharacterized protein n=1 Tax=Karstenula rhodostoma CBS 690.94 TaxID=1392251 RepID=A0A9P4PAA2_9PLEO|nr:hypothetical protein P171DRAFT_109841 [Karstenula rhodostoma CBS 690.94]
MGWAVLVSSFARRRVNSTRRRNERRATSRRTLLLSCIESAAAQDHLRRRCWPWGELWVGDGADGSDGSAMRASGCRRGVLHRAASPPSPGYPARRRL